jgi:hypothetical protein
MYFEVTCHLDLLRPVRLQALKPPTRRIDMNPLGFMDDLSMRGMRSLDLVDGDDVHDQFS